MAVNEKNALLRSKEANGDTNIIYPITLMDNVDGLFEVLEHCVFTVNGVEPIEGNVTLDVGASGGSDALILTITDMESEDIVIEGFDGITAINVPASLLNHTLTEVCEAITNGTCVRFEIEGFILHPVAYMDNSNMKGVLFQAEDGFVYGIVLIAMFTQDSSGDYLTVYQMNTQTYAQYVYGVGSSESDAYDPAGSADTALASAKEYTDNALAAYTPYAVQINTWEDDD